MDILKKNRSDLRSYFVKNAIPTESNFAELVEAMLNQKDDGIAKIAGEPLSIEAADSTGLQKAINFYGKLTDNAPQWSLQLFPRVNPNDAGTARLGFAVCDGGNNLPRLFIDKVTGNIGIGVNTPIGKLDVAGQVRIALDEGGSGPRSISFFRDAGDDINAGKIAFRGGFGADALHIVGAGANTLRKIKLWDNVEIVGTLTPGAGVNNGITFPKDPAGGSGDLAWLRYYARAGEQMTLELGTSNDPEDHIALMPSGYVGINNKAPIAKLDIMQSVRSGTHPAAVNALYVSGDFGPDSNGVEFRHTNATQGLGFGYNTIYAAGSLADQDVQLKAKGKGIVRLLGAAQVTDGAGYANANTYMASGSLTVGSINSHYGGGNGWTNNTAGLLLETKGNTEIAVHDAGQHVTSLMYYEGDCNNRITLGRDMGWDAASVQAAAALKVADMVSIGQDDYGCGSNSIMFTRGAGDADDVHAGKIAYRNGWGDALHLVGAGISPNRNIHLWDDVQVQSALSVNSTLTVSGASSFYGTLTAYGAITPSAGNSIYNGIMFPRDPGGGGGDAAWIRYYARSGEACTLEIGISNDPDDWINLVSSGGVRANGSLVLVSDKNLKTDIEALHYGLDEIKKLLPVSFNWKDRHNKQKNLGLLAQDVQKVMSELVFEGSGSDGSLAIAYMNLIPVLVNGIKELDEKIARVSALASA